MTRFWHVLADAIMRWRVLIWAALAVAAVVSAFGIPRIKFDTQQDTLVPSSSQLYKDNERYQSSFGGSQLEVIFTSDPLQLLSGDNLARLRNLHDEISTDGGFLTVISPLTLLDTAEVQVPLQVQQGLAEAQATQKNAADAARAAALAQGKSAAAADAAANAAGDAALQEYIANNADEAKQFADIGDLKATNPKFAAFVLYDAKGNVRPEVTGLVPDKTHALLVATLTGNLSVDAQNKAADHLRHYVTAAGFTNVQTTVAGENLLLEDISSSLQDSLPMLGGLSVALMILVVLFVFRARWKLLHLPVVAVALVIAFGIIGYAGFPMTMASTAGLPILVGLSVDFGIQFHNRHEEELERTRDARQAVRNSVAAITPALFTALLAACLGFAALRYSDMPMIRDFSAVLSIGIGVVFAVCLLALVSILYQRDRRLSPAAIPDRPDSFVERALAHILKATTGRAIPILLLGIIVAVGGFALDSRIETQTEPEQFIPSDSKTLQDLHELSHLTATANTVDFLVTCPDCTDPAVVTWMNALATDIQSKDSRVTGAQSLASIMATGTTNPDFSAPAIHDALTATPPDILKTAISPDHRSAAFSLTIREDVKLLDQKGIIDEVAESNVHPPDGVVMTPAGLGVLGIDAETRLTSHRLSMTVLALLAVLVLLLAVTRNVIYTLLVVGPVAMVIGWTSAAMYLFRVPLNPLTSVAGPLVVALGTEFGILLMLRYREERQHGLSPASAMGQAYILSGRAIAASALTVTGAFLALAFHPFPLLAEFGRVAVIGVALSFAGAMLLMPPLLIWADETLTPVHEEAHNPR